MTLVEVGGNMPKQNSNIAVESAPAVGCAYDTPEVYKLPMVRMSLMTDEIPNVRVYKAQEQKCSFPITEVCEDE